MNKKINILIIANKFDFTSDYVCLELQKRGANYFRINRDEFDKYKITLNLSTMVMVIDLGKEKFYFDKESLKAIYYRAPIYLRDIYKPNISKEEQLFRTQWTAFIRNLALFEEIIWINNPVSTFRAENKLLQLHLAQELGFLCPNTVITNSNLIEIEDEKSYIVKSLDTAILRIKDKEAFVYANVILGKEIKSSNLQLAPIVIQDYIYPKVDVRVTIIGSKLYAVRILQNNCGINGDWRREKDKVEFVPFDLPSDIGQKCIELVQKLGLTFGAIDLIESNQSYYFLEINPTGEWAWLVNAANLKIYENVCNYLEGQNDQNIL